MFACVGLEDYQDYMDKQNAVTTELQYFRSVNWRPTFLSVWSSTVREREIARER